jgi:hypothetical protein
MAARIRIEIRDNDDDYVDVTDRVVMGSVGRLSYTAETFGGVGILAPPSKMKLRNDDGWWTTEPTRVQGPYNPLRGAWEGRVVRFRRVTEEEEDVIGLFRVASPVGVEIEGQGVATMTLESMAEAIRRGDAGTVGAGRGWYADIPWTLAVDRYRVPDDLSSMSFPQTQIEYEALLGKERDVSSIGRPGDYDENGFHEVRYKAVDSTWNEQDRVFCFATHGELWEWDPETGLYDEVSLGFSIPNDHDILRVWWHKGYGSNTNYYLVMTAVREVSDEQQSSRSSGYYQPLDQKAEGCRAVTFWKHDRAVLLATLPVHASAPYDDYHPNLAPVIYRSSPHTTPAGSVVAQFGGEKNAVGDEQMENLTIPWAQYVFPLLSRRQHANDSTYYADPGGDLDEIEYRRVIEQALPGDGHLYSSVAEAEQSWTVEPDPAYPDNQVYHDSMLRSGRGYYQIHSDFGVVGPASPYFGGARYSLGNGPMIDASIPARPQDFDGGSGLAFFLAWTGWDRSSDTWHVCTALVRGSTQQIRVDAGSSRQLPQYTVPTFLHLDVNGYSNLRGFLFVGWYDPYGTDEGGSPSWRSARSGVGVYPMTAVYSTSPPDLSATAGGLKSILFTYTGSEGGALFERGYNTSDSNFPYGGRMTPVGMTAKQTFGGGTTVYEIGLFLLDRAEVQLSKQEKRPGIPYRMAKFVILYLGGSDSLILASGVLEKVRRFALPPMGCTRTLVGEVHGDEAESQFFYVPGEQAIYAYTPNDGVPIKRLGAVDFADSFLGIGRLAVGNFGGDRSDPRICGVTSPVFPLTGPERWPVGQYRAFYYGEAHGGRIPLLDNSDLSRWEGIRLAAEVGNSIYFIDRAGAGILKKRPDANTTPQFTLTPDKYGMGSKRRAAPIVTHAVRSVGKVVPREPEVTVLLSPYSEWNAQPLIMGFDSRPVYLELRCIQGGLVTAPPPWTNDPNLGQTLWTFRFLGRRMTAYLTADVSVGSYQFYLSEVAEIELGDLLTFSAVDSDMVVVGVDYDTGLVTTLSATAERTEFSYDEGAEVFIDKRADGRWSWPASDEIGRRDGVGQVATTANVGDARVHVTSLAGVGVGNIVAFVPTGSAGVQLPLYRVTRTIRRGDADESVGGRDEAWIEIEYVDPSGDYDASGAPGLREQAPSGSEIFSLVTLPQKSQQTPIGGSGLVFAVVGGGGTAGDDDEKPVLEGDRVVVDYAGFEIKRESHQKVTATDAAGVSLFGKQTPKNLKVNRFMDRQIANMDVNRRVRDGSQGAIDLVLRDVTDERARLLEPWDVIRVKDRDLLMDREDATPPFSAAFLVAQHHAKPDEDRADLYLHELTEQSGAAPFAGGVLAVETLEGLSGWWAADEIEGLSDTDPVEEWEDQSGRGHLLSQATATARPLYRTGIQNGLPGIWFDGTDDFLLGSQVGMHTNEARGWSSGGLTIYVVGQRDASKSFANSYVERWGGTSLNEWILRPDLMGVFEDVGTYATGGLYTVAQGSSPELMVLAWNPGGKVECYRGLTLLGLSASTIVDVGHAAVNLRIGANGFGFYFLKGHIFEVMISARYHATAERQATSNYLMNKWGL